VSIFAERNVFTRRQFFKGSGMLLAAAVVAGVFAKFGLDVYAASDDYIEKRIAGMYSLDESMAIRKSHQNPEILQLYKDFLSPGEVKPVSEKAHHLLHTRYGKDIPAMIEEMHAHTHEAA
jgi:hypothetical protein